jgi:signal transduction histidine kinase
VRWIGKIEDQSKYMNKIITDLQHYARPMILDCRETCIQDLLEEVTSTMGIPLNIVTSIEFEEGYPDLWIDPAMMRRVFINLITNAIQAMPDSGRLLIKGHTGDGAAYIDMMDTGEGMTEELMREIFKPLVTTKAKGTGLGLPVCKRIMDAHKGEILVVSEIGVGSIFTLKLNMGRWDLENGGRPTTSDLTGRPEAAVPIEHDDISVRF